MAEIRDVEPVKLIVGMLSAFAEVLDAAEADLAERFGPVDLKSPLLPFHFTDYYDRTMGRPLTRRFFSFRPLIDPGRLAEIKLQTNAVERAFADSGRWPAARPVNLDPGYVAPGKLVLASCKDFAHRVYLGRGVFAEVTLSWADGRWKSHEYTFPDYRSGEYHEFLSAVRAELMAKRKRERRT